MKIEPKAVALISSEMQEFEADAGAQWQLSPGAGRLDSIEPGRVRYWAPRIIWFSRDVRLTADAHGQSDSVSIALQSGPLWIAALTMLWPLPFLALVALLFWIWPGPAPVVPLTVYPPLVTAAAGASVQFSVSPRGEAAQNVGWSASDGTISPTGLFTAPRAATGRIVITVQKKDEPAHTATATAIVGNPLMLNPPLVELGPSRTVDLTLGGAHADAEWFVTPAGAVTLRDGHIAAPSRIAKLEAAIVNVRDKSDPQRQAAAVLLLVPNDATTVEGSMARERAFLALVLITGALGAFLGASRSFANFVGNRTFRASWAVFYLFRPLFGAGLALLVFFGWRTGAVTPFSAKPADPFGTAFMAGVVGLFADNVLGKLKDVIATLFPTQEPRADKLHPAQESSISDKQQRP